MLHLGAHSDILEQTSSLKGLGVQESQHEVIKEEHTLFSSPKHEVPKVSYCDRSMSVVRRASSVVRRQQFALKAYSFYTPGLIDSKLGRKHWGDL